MRLLTVDTWNPASKMRQLPPRANGQWAADKSHDSAELLQRTQAASNAEIPDSRYWTAYDHFMIERQARALRREYVYRLIANGWRRLRERLTASSPVNFGGPHR